MKLPVMALGASLFASFLPTTATAQTLPSSTSEALEASKPRFRFGFAGGVVGGAALGKDGGYTIPLLSPTLHLDLGVQLSDSVALYVHGEASTLLLMNQAAAYAVGEWTPVPWLSLGTGIGYDAIAQFPDMCGCSSRRTAWEGISVPLITAFNIGRSHSPGRADRALRLALPMAVGIAPDDSRIGIHGAVTIGWAML